jgi:phage shock protein A
MPDSPTPWELQRQIDRLRADLKDDIGQLIAGLQASNDRGENHVTETGLAALLGRYDDRIKGLGEDLAEERAYRKADIVAEQDARKDAVRRLEDSVAALTRNLRWIATAIVLPIGLFVADIALRRG